VEHGVEFTDIDRGQHVDVTKFANIPVGGGQKFVSRQQSRRNARETARRSGQRGNAPRIGTESGLTGPAPDRPAHLAFTMDWRVSSLATSQAGG
jgi:hypothetical protein